MFKKKKKVSIRLKLMQDGINGEKITYPLEANKALSFLESNFDKYGPLILNRVTESEIKVIPVRSELSNQNEISNDLIREKIESTLESLKEEIKNDQCIVLVSATPIGVFSNPELAEIKKGKLIEQGIPTEQIKITIVPTNKFN